MAEDPIVVVDGVRTPIATMGGALRDVTAQQLGTHAVKALLARTKIDPAVVDEVVFGCCGQSSDAPNIGRVILLQAGLPNSTPGFTVHRNCASGFQAVTSAGQAILAGDAEVVIAGGTESMSNIPFSLRDHRFGRKLQHSALIDGIWEGLTDPVCKQIMGLTAETLAAEGGITRAEQDAFAVESHRKAFRAQREGKLKEEIVPVDVPKKIPGRSPITEVVSQDEGINVALNPQMLAMYPTVFKEGGTVTPGNACPISDGAAAVLLMRGSKAKALGLEPLGTIRAHAYAALEPERMGLGPALAIPKALAKAGLKLEDIDLIEVNEAFAAQVLACQKKLAWDPAKVNVNGGAIALGHPVGMTGIRLVLTLLRELKRAGKKRGIASLCVGGGQGGAILLERS